MNTFLKWWLLVTLTVAGIVTGWSISPHLFTHTTSQNLQLLLVQLFIATTNRDWL